MVQQVTLTKIHPGSTDGRGYSKISRFSPTAVMTAALALKTMAVAPVK
jgi:hypothetical protein